MSSKEQLSALLATRGKGGSLESIAQAGKHFSNDTTLRPTDFITGSEKLDGSKAITLLGGYAVSAYGLEPKVVYSMRNAIAKQYQDVLDLFDYSKDEFIAGIAKIEQDIATKAAEKASLDASLGEDAQRFIKNAQAQIEKVIDGNVSPRVRHDLLTLQATITKKLETKTLKVAQSA